MTRIAFFDCFSGISGNMALGALLDCGLSLDPFRSELEKIGVRGFRLEAAEVNKAGLRALHVEVRVEEKQPARHPADVEAVIRGSSLPARVCERSLQVFRRLAEAEARVHGEPVERIHFHEVGAVDSIVDVVGTAIALEMLGVDEVYASALHIGAGRIRTAHGLLPVPAPATAELLKGMPVYGRDVEAELVTPTGAAILAALAAGFGVCPPMRVDRTGCGAGTRDLPWANLLRVTVGDSAESAPAGGRELIVEANIDDMNPQWYEHAMDRLFAAGALDVFLVPIQMKRNRPAVVLTVMAEEANLDSILGILFAETTTIGVRIHPVDREKLDREEAAVETPYGPVRVKIARRAGRVMNVAPEHRDCERIAREKNVPLKDVCQAALAAAQPYKR
jgi:uncharacterized protein (TIGR00299 family) protein